MKLPIASLPRSPPQQAPCKKGLKLVCSVSPSHLVLDLYPSSPLHYKRTLHMGRGSRELDP